MTEPMGERGRQGAAPLGGTDIETVRIALELMSDDPRIPALEALSRIEQVVEAANFHECIWGGRSHEDRYGGTSCPICEALGALDG